MKTAMVTPDEAPAPPRPRLPARLAAGAAVIRAHCARLGGGPGVYRMLNSGGEVLYVGKALNLKKRVAGYARPARLPVRLQRMVAETASMEFVTTASEVEALLLENNLIKRFAPRYNVLLRDDKSFPEILIPDGDPFPRIIKHRGRHVRPGSYFGPYASVGAVNEALDILQRVFLLRNCSDGVFRNRTRPCLQYQIKRCSAPCVAHISADDYGETVRQARRFLDGRSREIQEQLVTAMQEASTALNFELAARLRDRIRALTQVQARQDINIDGLADADIAALYREDGQSCIQIFFYRGGRNNGNRAYFPRHDRSLADADVMAAFLGQFYESRPPPRRVFVSHDVREADLLSAALSHKAGRKVLLHCPQRGAGRTAIRHGLENARTALMRRLGEHAGHRRNLAGLAELCGLEGLLARVEVYDNSHISGTRPVGAMIVAGPEGFEKKAYRKFNMRGEGRDDTAETTPESAPEPAGGDDYAMMREMFARRFARLAAAAEGNGDQGEGGSGSGDRDGDKQAGPVPDLVIVDGGKGQLSSARTVLRELGLQDVIPVLAVAKGPDRNAGREQLFLAGRAPVLLPPRDPVLYFIQRLRDEAHRFAIGAHRTRRRRALSGSPLDAVPGIGARRKRALLLHFGSARAVARAGIDDLAQVEGISRTMASGIFNHFHPGT